MADPEPLVSEISFRSEAPVEIKNLSSAENFKRKFRNVVITLNNYTTMELDAVKHYAEHIASYGVVGLEVAPTTGTPHLQIYLEFATQKTLLDLRRDISPRIAVFARRGSPLQASDYCKYDDYADHKKDRLYKKPNVFFEYGELSKQGNRADWDYAVQLIKEATPITEVIDNQPHLLPNIRALREYQTMISKSAHREVRVHVLFGASGSGKTRWAYENFPDLFSKSESKWWDGYSGQKAVLLDDFYGYIPFAEMLKICDRYPLSLEVKGGFTPALYTDIIITSNDPPSAWYGKLGALERRLTYIAQVVEEQPIVFLQGEGVHPKWVQPEVVAADPPRHPPRSFF